MRQVLYECLTVIKKRKKLFPTDDALKQEEGYYKKGYESNDDIVIPEELNVRVQQEIQKSRKRQKIPTIEMIAEDTGNTAGAIVYKVCLS